MRTTPSTLWRSSTPGIGETRPPTDHQPIGLQPPSHQPDGERPPIVHRSVAWLLNDIELLILNLLGSVAWLGCDCVGNDAGLGVCVIAVAGVCICFNEARFGRFWIRSFLLPPWPSVCNGFAFWTPVFDPPQILEKSDPPICLPPRPSVCNEKAQKWTQMWGVRPPFCPLGGTARASC